MYAPRRASCALAGMTTQSNAALRIMRFMVCRDSRISIQSIQFPTCQPVRILETKNPARAGFFRADRRLSLGAIGVVTGVTGLVGIVDRGLDVGFVAGFHRRLKLAQLR